MAGKDFNGYDPRKAVWNDVSIDDWETSQWQKWKPQHTGTNYLANVEREYLRIKYSVQQTNVQLDASKVKVKLKLTNHRSIGLQGTFPCKPGDKGKNGNPNKQYQISLGIPASDAGIKTAEAKARELDLLLMTKRFEWTLDLLGKQAQKAATPGEKSEKLISELIEEYEEEFWKTHKKNRQGLNNWKAHYLDQLKKLPHDVSLSNDALVKALESTPPLTEARFRLCWQLKKFCNFCGFDGAKIIKAYDTRQPKPKRRDVPSDESIVAGFNKIGSPLSLLADKVVNQPEQWQWVYGMLATYGLRPHELFAVDLKAFADPSNIYHLVTLNPELTGGTKTGERKCGIPPLHPKWVELFDLKNIRMIACKAEFRSRTKAISWKFLKIGIGFAPYDLRHAYAIRGHRLTIPVKAMADYMGHTVQEHTKTYQLWMSKDTNLEIYKDVVINKKVQTQEELRLILAFKEDEINALKTENESLKALLASQQLDKLLNY